MIGMSKVELSLVLEVDMSLFFENDMRDVVSYISKKYYETNDKN